MIAHHLVFSAYGFWLPNDPRGSWSDFVGAWELFRYGGKATKTSETCSIAARPHDRQSRLAAKELLRRPAIIFNSEQIEAIAAGFAEYSSRSKLGILACGILPDHVHLVVARHRLDAHQMVIQLKGAATRELSNRGVHPFQVETPLPKCFSRGEWDVFLDTEDDLERAIHYVENNPEKEGMPRQHWEFVTPLVHESLAATRLASFTRQERSAF